MQRFVCTVFFGAMLWLSAPAGASPIFYATPASSGIDGHPVSAAALFTFGEGSVEITLFNLVTDPKAVAQNLSAIMFVLNSIEVEAGACSDSGKACLESSGAYERTLSKGGSYSTSPTLLTTGWSLRNTGSDLLLCVICTGGNTPIAPAHTLIGGPGSDLSYDSPSGSLTGTSHNPFLAEAASFSLRIPGVSAMSTLDRVEMQFGTTAGQHRLQAECWGCPQALQIPIPEPPTDGLLAAAGLCLMIGGAWHKRRCRKPQTSPRS